MAVFVIAGVVVGYSVFIQDKVATEPKELFHDALIRNLSEDAVTCTVNQIQSGTTQNLTIQMDLASKTNARSVLTVDNADATVQTEEIVVSSGDYLRYTKVTTKTNSTNPTAKKPDYSRLLGKWIKTDGTKPPELFDQTALGGCVVPLVHLPTLSESSLSRQINADKVFVPNYAKSELAEVNKTMVRNYNVTIQPKEYVAFMKEIGKAGGLKLLDKLNTAEFANRVPRNAIFSVDTKTGRIIQIQFTDESRTVTFKDYGKVPDLQAPSKVMTNKEAAKLIAQ